MNLGLSGRDLVGPAGIGAAVLFAVLFARSCNRADSAEAELKRERDSANLRDAGMPPEVAENAKAVAEKVEELKRESAAFKAALEDAQAKLKAAGEKPPKVVEVVRYVTKPGSAGGTAPDAAPRPQAPGGGMEGGGEAREPGPGASSCLVSPGDTMQIQVSEATLETRAGNRIITGSAACRRLLPKPETTIYEAPIAMNLTQATILEQPGAPQARPWIAGLVGSYGGSGKWGVGPSVGYGGSRMIFTLGGTFGSDSRAIASVHGRF